MNTITTVGIDLAKSISVCMSLTATVRLSAQNTQHTTGGKIRLGRITKRGDVYLRTLLIHGTRAVLAMLKEKQDRVSCWLRELVDRRGYKRTAVALAAKNARVIWALLVKGTEYERYGLPPLELAA